MIASVLAELLKLARRPATWLIVGVWMTLSLVFGYIFPYFSYRGTPSGPNADANLGEGVLSEALPAAFLGILVRGTALGVGIGLVWVLAVENLLRIFGSIVEVVDVVQRVLPGTKAGAPAAALGVPVQGQPGGTPGVTDVVGGRSAALVLVAYLAMFVAASAALINRRDVT